MANFVIHGNKLSIIRNNRAAVFNWGILKAQRQAIFISLVIVCFLFVLTAYPRYQLSLFKQYEDFDGESSISSHLRAINWRTCCRDVKSTKDICGIKDCTEQCGESSEKITFENQFGSSSSPDGRAFMVETSGSINYRQACSVESLARLNPNLKVHFISINRGNASSSPDSTTQLLLNFLKEKYSNIQPVRISGLDVLMSQTLLDNWYFCSDWIQGPYTMAHLSDALRLLLLSKYGGYYFDLDVIFVQPLSRMDVNKNFAASQIDSLANGILNFERSHPLIQLAIQNFRDNYKADLWSHNGPDVLNRLVTKWCGLGENITSLLQVYQKLSNSSKASLTLSCSKLQQDAQFTMLHHRTFFPIHYNDWELYFKETLQSGLKDADPRTIGIHVWNKLSSKKFVRKKSPVIYAQLAKYYCPQIYAIAPEPL